MKKAYNNLSDIERYILREYQSWKRSAAPLAYKFKMLTYWRQRANQKEIGHLL